MRDWTMSRCAGRHAAMSSACAWARARPTVSRRDCCSRCSGVSARRGIPPRAASCCCDSTALLSHPRAMRQRRTAWIGNASPPVFSRAGRRHPEIGHRATSAATRGTRRNPLLSSRLPRDNRTWQSRCLTIRPFLARGWSKAPLLTLPTRGRADGSVSEHAREACARAPSLPVAMCSRAPQGADHDHVSVHHA